MAALTKTETRILERMNDRRKRIGSGRYATTNKREFNAAVKLIKRGIVKGKLEESSVLVKTEMGYARRNCSYVILEDI